MATKNDFTEAQWQTLVFAIQDTMMFVSVSNGAKFFEGMGEAMATARFLTDQAKTSTSTLVRDLAMGIKGRDKELSKDPAALEATVLDRIAAAVAVVSEVAADELDAFKAFLVGVAEATAEAKNGIDEAEANAIEKVKSALL
jgi:hypothetical protein